MFQLQEGLVLATALYSKQFMSIDKLCMIFLMHLTHSASPK